MTEKEAVNFAGLARGAGRAVRTGLGHLAPAVASAKQTVMPTLQAAGQKAQQLGSAAMNVTPGKALGAVADGVGSVGQFTANTMRRGLNAADDMGRWAMNGPGKMAPAGQRLGDQTVGRTQAMAKQMFGSSAMTNKRNPLNLAVGGGTLAAGAHYSGLLGGGGGEAQPQGSAAQQFGAQMGQQASGAAGAAGAGAGGFGSSRMMDMWNNLPVEARYAIGAGVPMALLGGYLGRKGGLGGLGMAGLGLGAAGLGAAAGGAFGDDARRMVGKGIYNVGSFFGGNNNDPASQINMLGKLSPGLGATVLMGRDPNLSAQDAQQQYEFLTKNKDIIAKMLPQLTGKSASSLVGTVLLAEEEKTARCWKGYEPVPGKAPYSDGSCRPVGSKKKKPAEKKSAEECCGPASVPEHVSTEPTKQIKPKPAIVTSDKKVITGDLGQKKADNVADNKSHFTHPEKELEPVVNGKKPSQEGTKHHKVNPKLPDSGEKLSPAGAMMAPDMKPTSD